MEYIVVKLNDLRFLVDFSEISEIIPNNINITSMPLSSKFQKGIILYRDKVISLMDSKLLLDMDLTPYDRKSVILVLNIEENLVGFLVDEAMSILKSDSEEQIVEQDGINHQKLNLKILIGNCV